MFSRCLSLGGWPLPNNHRAMPVPAIGSLTKINSPTDLNYASYYEYRSENSNACVQRKHHDWPDDTIPSGTTFFSKVRLSLRTLQIIDDDLTFAVTNGRRSQTFGSAGDCYSSVPCPQGRFSINFERTKFRIRPKTEWETRGQNATILYHAKVSCCCSEFFYLPKKIHKI